MYCSTHLVGGATAALAARNPAIAFVLGLTSHALLDMVPHHDYGKVGPGLIDVAVGIILLLAIRSFGIGPQVVWGALGGVLPDLEVVWAYFHPASYALPHGYKKLIFPSHNGLLLQRSLQLPWGFLIQCCIIVAGFLILRAFQT